ncbi:carboxylesterase [Colletotrichum caudatum]|nr:carboxylesterase [Colletotrichum caudatum]
MGSTIEDARPSVTLTQGTVVGATLTDGLPRPVEAFKGIPYALPPTGDRRFRAPVKVEPSTETIDASKWGAVAPGKQLFPGGPSYEYSEDCLTANVFRTPRTDAAGEKPPLLPVAVHIHGGAFNRGTAMMHNTPSFLAHSGQELVAVTFNYRIGALGFLPSAMSFEEGALNLGLKDQILLLEWVRDNIASFGGDPNNVTLIGISAGGHSIGHIMLHDEGQYDPPLFHKVILESGAPTSRAVRPYSAPVHEAQFADFLAETGCPPGLSAAETFAHLRGAPTEVVQRAQIAVFDKYNPSLRWAFQPVIDGDIIPRPPMESWRLGRWRRVPVMTGFNRNEGSIYISKKASASDEFTRFFADLLPLLSEEDVAAIDRLYPDPLAVADSPYGGELDGAGAQYRRLEVAYGQYAYVAPVRQTADLASRAASAEPVYLYQWALESSVLDGARHGENMSYETCEPAKMGLSPTQRELCLALNAYVASFVAAGDPNAVRGGSSPDRPAWERYVADDPKAMVFAEENKELVGGAPGAPAKLCPDTWARTESEFWWSKVDLSQQ